MPTTSEHPLYRDDRIRMFVDPSTWYDFLRERDFAFGTRLHGNIAALLAGTPAYLLTFDSRTTEVAEHHALPHAPLGSVPEDVHPAALYDRADFSEFNARRSTLLAHYTAFLETNGLAHVHQPGNENPGFQHQLAEVAFCGPVGPSSPAGAGAPSLVDRLRARVFG